MKHSTSGSTASALLAFALFAVTACGGDPESGSTEGEEAGTEQESPAQVMAAEGEQGAERSAMEGTEHVGEVEGDEGGEADEGREGRQAGGHDEGGEHGEEGERGERGEGGEHGEAERGEHAEGGGRGEHPAGGEHGEDARGEHAEGGEHGGEGHGEEGEESGEYLGRTQSWDATRRGIRLRLTFDAERDAFVGTVENTTEATVCAVRVEVHLRPGPELGPTERRDLAPGESAAVQLPAGGETFEEWTAHPETSACGTD